MRKVGSAQSVVNTKVMKKMLVPKIPIRLQEQFAVIVESISSLQDPRHLHKNIQIHLSRDVNMSSITNEMKSEIKKLWNALWSGGIANPLNAMEQISYFLYMRRLSVMDEESRQKAEFTGETYTSVFEGNSNVDGTTSNILMGNQCYSR